MKGKKDQEAFSWLVLITKALSAFGAFFTELYAGHRGP
jgi:hypothetical protein